MIFAYGQGRIHKVNVSSGDPSLTSTFDDDPEQLQSHPKFILHENTSDLWIGNWNSGNGVIERIQDDGTPLSLDVAYSGQPNDAVFDGSKLWIVNGSGTLHEVHDKTDLNNKTDHTLPGSPNFKSVVLKGQDLWIVDYSGTLKRIDTNDPGIIIGNVDLSTNPTKVIADINQSNILWIIGEDGLLHQVNISGPSSVAGSPYSLGTTLGGIVQLGTELYITDWNDGDGRVIKVDTSDPGNIIGSTNTNDEIGAYPSDIILDQNNTNILWVANRNGTLHKVDRVNMEELNTGSRFVIAGGNLEKIVQKGTDLFITDPGPRITISTSDICQETIYSSSVTLSDGGGTITPSVLTETFDGSSHNINGSTFTSDVVQSPGLKTFHLRIQDDQNPEPAISYYWGGVNVIAKPTATITAQYNSELIGNGVCKIPGVNIILTGGTNGANFDSWTLPSGNGSFTVQDINSEYIISDFDKGSTVTIGLNTGDPTGPCGPAYAEVDIPVYEDDASECRDPANVVLVLDKSGSMTLFDPHTGQPRYLALQQALEIFLTGLTIFPSTNDKIDVVYYRTDVDPPATVTLEPIIPGTTVNAIMSEVETVPSIGATAMGAGIQVALRDLNPNPGPDDVVNAPILLNPVVIVFTDGEQNVGPELQEISPGVFDIIDVPGFCSSFVNGSTGPSVDQYHLPVIAISIAHGPGEFYYDLLNGMSQSTGAQAYSADGGGDLTQFFINALQQALNINTLELIDYRYGNLGSGQTLDETVVLEDGIKRVSFMVKWNQASTPVGFDQFLIDGPSNTDLEPTRWVKGDFYTFAVFDFPYELDNGTVINDVGEWKIYTTDPAAGNVSFEMSVLADTDELHYEVEADTEDDWAEEEVTVTVEVTDENDQPVDDVEVEADVTSSDTNVGTVMAENDIPEGEEDDTCDDIDNDAQRKYNILWKDEKIRELLTPRTTKIKFNDDGVEGDEKKGDGIFSYRYTKTDVPGPYTFNVKIRGKTRNGVFQRKEVFTRRLKLKPDPKQTLLRFTKYKDKKTRKVYPMIQVTPKSRAGFYLGPGNKDLVKFRFSSKEYQDIKVMDDLKGCYEAVILTEKFDKNVKVEIIVRGITVYEGPLYLINKHSKFSKNTKRK